MKPEVAHILVDGATTIAFFIFMAILVIANR